ncbi:hypothetical protein N431DRAFT_329544 [Stipitochalara longipes BDJ]|nr:hypothetical protein N431DRAFT_329544 [Stipitochalara longipes BDJ]
MSSSLLSVPGIKIGVWTNYDHGKIQGATLTIAARHGGYLIAFLALYVSITGAQLWIIIKFFLHRWNNPPKIRNALYAQQQLVLRNSESPLNTAFRLIQISWVWRQVVPRAVIRSLHFITLSFLVLAAFAVGGIFSSEVSKATDSSVLVEGNECGLLTVTGDSLATFQAVFLLNRRLFNAWNYARTCYQVSTDQLQCSLYAKPSLEWATDTKAPCPFDESLCILSGNKSVRLDSGLLNSHRDFGVNSLPKNRVDYRKVTTCAPTHSEPFSSLGNSTFDTNDPRAYNSSIHDPNYGVRGPFLKFYYGTMDPSTYGTNASTYTYNIQNSYSSKEYELSYVPRQTNAVNYWTPIPQLQRTDATVALIFLAQNGVVYSEPVDDPWFAAHRPRITKVTTFNAAGNTTSNLTSYMPDAYFHVPGCADQYQICNTGTTNCSALGSCTALGGGLMDGSLMQELQMNKYQNETAALIHGTSLGFTGQSVSLGGYTLNASQAFAAGFLSKPLPDNQWMLEVANWFAIYLAGQQQAMVEYAASPSEDHPATETIGSLTTYGDPDSVVTKTLCHSQKIRSTGQYQNFPILRISCIIGTGGFIILISWFLESLLGLVDKKWKNGQEKVRWISDSTFQVQRMMYEGYGYGKWEGDMDVIPLYLGEDLEFPTELDKGRCCVPRRKTSEKFEEHSSQKLPESLTVEVNKLSSRSGSEILVEHAPNSSQQQSVTC